MPQRTLRVKSRVWMIVPSVFLAMLLAGCELLGVREQHELDRQVIRLRGTVSTQTPLEGNLVVVLIRRVSADRSDDEIIDHYVVERVGNRFQFYVTSPGRYALAAFNDRDHDLVYERDEPVYVSNPKMTFELARGTQLDGLDIFIDPAGRANPQDPIDILEFQSRNAQDQLAISMGQLQSVGEVTTLSDPRFSQAVGSKGLWSPYDFIFDVGVGVFFLQPYDPEKIPVLFIHGILGFPAQFGELIESLDQERFQPWVYLYPSGAKLKNVATNLTQLVIQLESRYEFEDIAFVAHSMGGLVTRAFLLDYYEETNNSHPQELITISTPWSGQASAALGAERLRNPVYSWVDIAPGSDFLRDLFFEDATETTRRLLPPRLVPHLLFGFQGKGGGEPNDGVVTVASQLRSEAQQDASSIWGVNATHTSILKDEETQDRMNTLLGSYADEL